MIEYLPPSSATSAPFASEFEWAVVRLATFKPDQGDTLLLFTSISLLTAGRTPPAPMSGIDSFKVARNGGSVAFRRITMTVEHALEWYRTLDHKSLTPIPSCEGEVDARFDGGYSFFVGTLIDQPAWPEIGLPMLTGLFSLEDDGDSPPPLVLGGKGVNRIHRRLGSQSSFDRFLSDARAVRAIERRMHINLRSYPEYLGSALLLVPDPIIKRIENFMVPADADRGERIIYRIIPHSNQKLNALSMTFIGETSDLLLKHEVLPVPTDGLIDMQVGLAMDRYSYVIGHPKQGLLRHLPPTSFLRAMNLQMSMTEKQFHVSVPATNSSKSAISRYTAARSEPISTQTLQSAPIPQNVNSRLASAQRDRYIARHAKKLEQTWFAEGDREAALKFVRERIARATKRVMIAEPYFGVLQIPQYLLSVSSSRVRIEILTSVLAFTDKNAKLNDEGDVGLTPDAVRWRKAQEFHHALEHLQNVNESPVNATIMPGNPPMLHDRFLVIDDHVWFLGNSLNSLGLRGSMTVKLPDPRPVLIQLEALLRNGETFAHYFANLQQKMGQKT